MGHFVKKYNTLQFILNAISLTFYLEYDKYDFIHAILLSAQYSPSVAILTAVAFVVSLMTLEWTRVDDDLAKSLGL